MERSHYTKKWDCAGRGPAPPPPGCVCWTRFLSAFHQQPRKHGRLQRNPLAAAPGQLSGVTPLRAEGWGFPNYLMQQRLFLDHIASSCPAFPHTPAGIQLTRMKKLARSGGKNIGSRVYLGPLGSRYQDRVTRARELFQVMPVMVQKAREQD